jgi:hypothetical protein
VSRQAQAPTSVGAIRDAGEGVSEYFDVQDEAQLLRALGATFADEDPLPEHLARYARALFELGGLDAELAQLTYDSMLDRTPVPIRGDAGVGRVLIFTWPRLTLELTCSLEGRVLGQLDPPEACVVRFQRGSGEDHLSSDDDGSFVFQTPDELFRLLVESVSGTMRTDWVDLRPPE